MIVFVLFLTLVGLIAGYEAYDEVCRQEHEAMKPVELITWGNDEQEVSK
jgi:hypothetical protein